MKPKAHAEADPRETPSNPRNEQNLNQNEHRQPHETVRDENIQHLDDLEQVTYYPDTTHRDEDEENIVSAEETDSRYPKRNRKPPSYFVPGSAHSAFYADSTDSFEVLSSVQEALKMDDSDEWQEAINSELSLLKQHGTWEVVAKLEEAKPLPTRFVFVRKYDESGNIIRHKARLVVKGFMQGDVHMTFAQLSISRLFELLLQLLCKIGFLFIKWMCGPHSRMETWMNQYTSRLQREYLYVSQDRI